VGAAVPLYESTLFSASASIGTLFSAKFQTIVLPRDEEECAFGNNFLDAKRRSL
jgi:hypothetical protein